MLRELDLKEISDGKYYKLDDICKVDTAGCNHCMDCCIGMEDTIILDPADIFHLSIALNEHPENLLNQYIELGNVDNILLPHLLFKSNTSKCRFLSEEGRCSIYKYRPGICHLFPLGRIYHDDTFDYFLQTHECTKRNLIKTKIRKWIGIENIKQYDQYIIDWHSFLNMIKEKMQSENPDHDTFYQWNLLILKLFFFKPYIKDSYNIEKDKVSDIDFYPEFYERLEYAKEIFFD